MSGSLPATSGAELAAGGFVPGKRVHVLPIQAAGGTVPTNSSAPTPPSCTHSPCNISLQYYGGDVIPNVKPYVVLWTSAVTLPGSMAAFFQAVTSNDYWDWLDEYDTNVNPTAGSRSGSAGTNQLIGRGVYGGQYTITPTIATGKKVSDTQLQQELDAQIKAGNLPVPDANTIYMVYFPSGYAITQGGSSSCTAFCAYHGTYTGNYTGKSQNVFYAPFPDFTQAGCSTGCGKGTTYQNLCAASAHELGEATTDADVGLGTTVDYPLAWYDANGNGEIGDMCNQHTDTISSLFDGNTYTVQQLYSKSSGMCQTTQYAATDFKVWLKPNTVSLVAGSVATASLPLSSAITGGGSQTLALSVSGLPANVTGSLGAASLSAGAGTTLTLSAAAATAASKDAVGMVQASNGTVTHTVGFLVQVSVPANEFSMSVAAPSTTLSPGGNTPVALSTSVVQGTAEAISFSVGGLPSGVTATFNPTSVTAGGSSTLTLTASTSAAAGTATIDVFGTTTSTEKLASVSLTVAAPPVTVKKYSISGLPASVTAGATSALTITAQDSTGATVTSYNGTANLTSTDGQAVFPASVTFTSGVATGVNVTFKTAGAQSITATDSATPSITGSASTTVAPAAAASYVLSGVPASVIAGSTTSLTVTAQDPYGNTATGYQGTASFTSSDVQASLPASTAFTSGVAQGLSVTFKTAGTQSVTAADTGAPALTGSASTVVGPATVSRYAITSTATDTAGVAATFNLTAEDSFGNKVPGYAGTAAFTSTDPQAALPANTTFAGGQASVAATFKTAGQQTLTATDVAASSVSGSFTAQVQAAAASSYAISGVASTVPAGATLLVTVTAHDALGNVATGYAGTAVVTSTDAAATYPASVSFASGVASGVAVVFNTQGMQSLTFRDSAQSALTATASTNVNPDLPAAQVTAPADGSTVQGTVTVTATGKAGNGATLTKLELYVDGTLLSSGASSPVSASWSTTQVSNGSHSLTAKAYQTGGLTSTSSAVVVTVSNPSGHGSDGGSPDGGGGDTGRLSSGCGCSTGAAAAEDLLFGLLLFGFAPFARARGRRR